MLHTLMLIELINEQREQEWLDMVAQDQWQHTATLAPTVTKATFWRNLWHHCGSILTSSLAAALLWYGTIDDHYFPISYPEW